MYHNTQKIALIVDSSMEAEAHATAKAASSSAMRARCSAPSASHSSRPRSSAPTTLPTSTSARACPARSRHFLQQRVANKEIHLRHVMDADMPADFLTKRISALKLEKSVRYATNSYHLKN